MNTTDPTPFLQELTELCKKHGMMPSPLFDQQDTFVLMPLDKEEIDDPAWGFEATWDRQMGGFLLEWEKFDD